MLLTVRCQANSEAEVSANSYFDSTGLVSWADAQAPNPPLIDSVAARNVEEILGEAGLHALSEITLLEVQGTIWTHARDPKRAEQTEEWASRAIDNLMAIIADGRLQVLPTPTKVAECAMVLVAQVTRSSGRGLKAWDATHVVQVLRWSRDLGAQVTLVTSDGVFARVLETFPEFRAHIVLRDPNVATSAAS
jgi:hypothetical protein